MISLWFLSFSALSLTERSSFWEQWGSSWNIMQKIVLPQNTTLKLGKVELSVWNLNLMRDFYTASVGLEILKSWESFVILGKNGEALLTLSEEKIFQKAAKNEAGLYHTALVFETQSQLAHTLKKILEDTPELYEGSADHSATQAFYFHDPEGNGLELYFDKPREAWLYKNGKPVLGSYSLDPISFLNTYLPLIPASENIHMGHIHLKVGNIPDAQKFYNEILLFEVIENMGTTLFVSRDGYHHHIGMNVWESSGAWKRKEWTLGLKSFEIDFLDQNAYDLVLKSLEKNSIPFKSHSQGVEFQDPWGNIIILKKI